MFCRGCACSQVFRENRLDGRHDSRRVSLNLRVLTRVWQRISQILGPPLKLSSQLHLRRLLSQPHLLLIWLLFLLQKHIVGWQARGKWNSLEHVKSLLVRRVVGVTSVLCIDPIRFYVVWKIPGYNGVWDLSRIHTGRGSRAYEALISLKGGFAQLRFRRVDSIGEARASL